MALIKALVDGLKPLVQGQAMSDPRIPNVGVRPMPEPVQAAQLPPAPQFLHEGSTGFESNQPMLHDASVGYQNNPQMPQTNWYEMKAGGGKFTPEETPWYQNRELMNRLALGFNTMRLNPDQSLAATLGEELKDIRATRVSNKTATAVIQQLRAMGEKEAADIVEANPAVAKDVLQQIIQAKYARKASPTVSGIQTDPDTGQQYVSRFRPDTMDVERVDIAGAKGETPKQKAERESSERLKVFGMEKAAVAGQEIYKRASSLNEAITLLNRAKEVVTKGGAQSGIIRSMLPAFDSATAELNEIASRLGINIINSATFGALSEKELGLALSTGLDRSLSGDELVKHIQDKISAQEKLYNQLMSDARLLTSGMTMNEYVQMRTSEPRKTPFPVYGGAVQLPPNLRSQMSEDEVAAFNRLPADMQQKFINGQ